ncbi:hypothetical protein F4801DRAFT_583135 [Xylaria longipes]|nr:hypothetical protein F4801DRAFT_583135 [Xylaria longipes]
MSVLNYAGGEHFSKNLEKWKSIVEDEKEREKKKREGHPQLTQTRWGLLDELLAAYGVPGKKLFQAHLIAELTKADQKRILNWRDLEPIVQSRFPRDIGQVMLKAIRGKQSTPC